MAHERSLPYNLSPMAQIYESDSYTPTQTDLYFNLVFEKIFGAYLERGFYVPLAGVSRRNSDGLARTRVVKSCGVGQFLHPRLEPDNRFDPFAVAITQSDGIELGYLPARVAREATDAVRGGVKLGAIFRCRAYHPITEKTVGAIILLLFLRDWDGPFYCTPEIGAAMDHQFHRYGIDR